MLNPLFLRLPVGVESFELGQASRLSLERGCERGCQQLAVWGGSFKLPALWLDVRSSSRMRYRHVTIRCNAGDVSVLLRQK